MEEAGILPVRAKKEGYRVSLIEVLGSRRREGFECPHGNVNRPVSALSQSGSRATTTAARKGSVAEAAESSTPPIDRRFLKNGSHVS